MPPAVSSVLYTSHSSCKELPSVPRLDLALFTSESLYPLLSFPGMLPLFASHSVRLSSGVTSSREESFSDSLAGLSILLCASLAPCANLYQVTLWFHDTAFLQGCVFLEDGSCVLSFCCPPHDSE